MTTIFGVEDGPDVDNLTADLDGFKVIARRGMHGAWCGYIAVPPGHPWFGVEYPMIDAHGGCTYSKANVPGTGGETRTRGLWTAEIPGLWWVGFDCLHSGDAPPPWAEKAHWGPWASGNTYRTLGYVEDNLRALVAEAKEVGSGQKEEHGAD